MDVSIFAAFVAGLVSFLSPCVLPLVPGYVSMLSGIGVEQLKTGETPRASLLTSSLAFVSGFSIVFITFGASASAVGAFLLRNRTLLAPLAGASGGSIWPASDRMVGKDTSTAGIDYRRGVGGSGGSAGLGIFGKSCMEFCQCIWFPLR